jgi:hypothetical protein
MWATERRPKELVDVPLKVKGHSGQIQISAEIKG